MLTSLFLQSLSDNFFIFFFSLISCKWVWFGANWIWYYLCTTKSFCSVLHQSKNRMCCLVTISAVTTLVCSILIETVSAGGHSARPAKLGVHPIWWWWHGNTKSLSNVQSSDVSCILTSQLAFSLWFNCGYWRENTSMNIVWYMIMAFVRWSKQHRMVT